MVIKIYLYYKADVKDIPDIYKTSQFLFEDEIGWYYRIGEPDEGEKKDKPVCETKILLPPGMISCGSAYCFTGYPTYLTTLSNVSSTIYGISKIW